MSICIFCFLTNCNCICVIPPNKKTLYNLKGYKCFNIQCVEHYFDTLMDKYPDGKMSVEDFIDTFKVAFPERPEEKVQKLAENMANKDGKICEL